MFVIERKRRFAVRWWIRRDASSLIGPRQVAWELLVFV